MENTITLRMQYLDNVVLNFLDSALVDSAYTLLKAEKTYSSDMALAALYLNNNDFASAQEVIDSMDYDDPDFDNWKQLFQIQLNLEVDSLTLSDMDSTDYAFVEALANSGDCELSNIQARAIISFLKGTEFESCDNESEERGGTNYNSSNDQGLVPFKLLNDKEGFLKVIPNPFSSSSVVSYQLKHEEGGARLQLMNYTGQILMDFLPKGAARCVKGKEL